MEPSLEQLWIERERHSVLLGTRVATGLGALAYVVFHFVVDLPLGLDLRIAIPFRIVMTLWCLAGFALTWAPPVRTGRFYRWPIAIMGGGCCIAQARTLVWFPQLSIYDATILPVVVALILQMAPARTVLYLLGIFALQFPQFLQAKSGPSQIAAAYLINMLAIVSIRSRHSLSKQFFETLHEKQKAERALLQAQAQMERQSRLVHLGQLAAGMAHEVGNPLNFAGGGAVEAQSQLDRLRKSAANGEPIGIRELEPLETALGLVIQGTQRIRMIIQSLRRYIVDSHVEQVSTDLGAELNSTLALVAPKLLASAIEVRREGTDPLVVACRPGEVGQILLNLVMNACEAMPKGGEIVATLRRSEKQAEVVISDTGTGIPAADQASIFQPFFTTRDTGTGLGLSISQELARRNGGELVLLPSKRGAAFMLRLPLVPDAPSQANIAG